MAGPSGSRCCGHRARRDRCRRGVLRRRGCRAAGAVAAAPAGALHLARAGGRRGERAPVQRARLRQAAHYRKPVARFPAQCQPAGGAYGLLRAPPASGRRAAVPAKQRPAADAPHGGNAWRGAERGERWLRQRQGQRLYRGQVPAPYAPSLNRLPLQCASPEHEAAADVVFTRPAPTLRVPLAPRAIAGARRARGTAAFTRGAARLSPSPVSGKLLARPLHG
ncbi:hypothetical protein CT19431_MP80092 [Cupriavidus taiwanensis]|nr:hypothetical protein CT19431_MP80092 [Cupriavidus taiwanensis]